MDRSIRQAMLKEAIDLVHEANIKLTGQGSVHICVVVSHDVIRYAAIVEIIQLLVCLVLPVDALNRSLGSK